MADLLPSSPDPAAGKDGDPRVIGVDSDDADDLLAALQSETARELLAALYDEPATPSALAEAVDTSIQNVRYHLEKLTDADLVEVADTVYSEKGREMKVYAPAAKPLVVFAGGDDAPGLESALSQLLGGLGLLGLSSLLVQRLASDGSLIPNVTFSSGDSQAEPGGVNTSADSEVDYAGGDDVDVGTEAADEQAATGTEEPTGGGPNAASDTTADAAQETTAESASTPTDSAETVGEATETAAEATRTAADGADVTYETGATDVLAETTRIATETAGTASDGGATTTVTEAMGSATSGLPPGLVFFAGGVVVLAALGVAWYLRAR